MAKKKASQAEKNTNSSSKNAEQKASVPTDSELRFYVLRPNKVRREWAIQAYKEPVRRGKREYFKSGTDIFKELALKCQPINDQYQAQGIDDKQAEDMLKEIIKDYRTRQGTKEFALRTSRLSKANESLLAKFWDTRYAHKNLADPKSAQADFHRALRLAGDVSLYTATAIEITENLADNCASIDQYRRAVASLNEVFKFIKRELVLEKPEKDYKVIDFITVDEVEVLAERAPTELFKLMTWVLFGTGARFSEALAINDRSLLIGERKVFIDKQRPGIVKKSKELSKLDKLRKGANSKFKPPKRGKKGRVAVIKVAWKYVEKWAKEVSEKEKENFPYAEYYNWIVSKSASLWPDDSKKHITPHDLRHSHAIHLLDHGATIVEVARNLRNRIEICQEYYTGYDHTDDSLDTLADKI